VAQDFGDAHDGDIFGADGLALPFGGHFGSAEAGEGRGGEMLFQFGDEARAVVVARGFAGREKKDRVWRSSDKLSLQPQFSD
jgi:hypothetical protein